MRKFYSVRRVQRTAISEHTCRGFNIERSAQTLVDAIRAVMEGKK